MAVEANGDQDLVELMDQIEALLKSPSIGATLTSRGINTSLALLAAQGLRAYLQGHKRQAADDLATAAEEIGARLVGG